PPDVAQLPSRQWLSRGEWRDARPVPTTLIRVGNLHQPAAVGNARGLRSIVFGLFFTMKDATRTCRRERAARRHLALERWPGRIEDMRSTGIRGYARRWWRARRRHHPGSSA